MGELKLSVQGLTRRFVVHIRDGLTVEALDNVSFDVERGEFLGLVGPSGSGKSSLLKCLYRTYLPDAGSALYTATSGEVVDLVGADEHTMLALRRGAIGYVSQFLRVIPRVTVERTLAAPLLATGTDTPDALRQARVLLERLNLPQDLWGSFPALLSGGEQQRVNLARALAPRPDLMLLDEPTSALDATNQSAVVELLAERLEDGATMVGAFHDAPTLTRLASRVARLERGRLVEVGSLAQVLEPELEAVS